MANERESTKKHDDIKYKKKQEIEMDMDKMRKIMKIGRCY